MAASSLLGARDLQQVHNVTELLGVLQCDDALWQAFIGQVGGPGNNIRVLAALPQHMVTAGAMNGVLPSGDGLTPMQATHLGLVWRTSRKIVHLWAGAPEGEFEDVDPWLEEAKKKLQNQTPGDGKAAEPQTLKERVLKMNQLVDQLDETELKPPTKNELQKWHTAYVAVMGASPQEEEEPSENQLAALHKKVYGLGQSPYCDFAVWQPFNRRSMKTLKFRTYHPLGDGSYLMRELPGPQNLQQWLLSWRVFKVAAISLDICSLASLQLYEKTVERLVLQWPGCWGLIAAAEDKGRSEKWDKWRRKYLQEEANGGALPADWHPDKPWTSCLRALAMDEEYWNEQVRHPAASWVAAGSRGMALAPAEQVAAAHFPGGAEVLDHSWEEPDTKKRQSNRDKRMARSKRIRADREELEKLRGHRAEGKGGSGGKGKQKGKSKDQSGVQICYSYANGTGPCGQLPPGAECLQRTKRAHKCQLCLSPGHRNSECPSSKKA